MKQISQLADNAKTNQAANNAEAAPAPYIAVAESKFPQRRRCSKPVGALFRHLTISGATAGCGGVIALVRPSTALAASDRKPRISTNSRVAWVRFFWCIGGVVYPRCARREDAWQCGHRCTCYDPRRCRSVLIFLATFGGVAVFSRAEPEPNAYAVFFACFIAAVFSEDVWAWAQRRQTAELGKTGGNAAGGADRGASGADIPRPNNPAEAITPARGPSDPPRDR